MSIQTEREIDSEGISVRYVELPVIARWKALITENGVDFENPRLFNQIEGIEAYKTKRRALKPTIKNLQVFDESTEESLIPSELVISNNNDKSIVKLGYRPGSPIEIALDDSNNVILKEKITQQRIPVEANLVKRKNYQNVRIPKEIDPNTPKLSDFVDVVGLDRISVMTFDGCWNWNSGKPCSFCDFNPKREDFIGAKPSTNTIRKFDGDIDKWWGEQRSLYLTGMEYAFRYLIEKEDLRPHQHLLIMSGNLPNPQKVWDSAAEVIKTLNKVKAVESFDNYLNICPHPSVEALKKAKDLGVKQVQYNLEVIGAEVFATMCPGKMEYFSFKKKLEEAVGIMGFGNVRSNFVLGIQPVEDLLLGVKELADKGIVADFSIFQPKKSTPLANHTSPSMDTIVYFTKELAKIYKIHGFHGIYCSLSSRSSIINECL